MSCRTRRDLMALLSAIVAGHAWHRAACREVPAGDDRDVFRRRPASRVVTSSRRELLRAEGLTEIQLRAGRRKGCSCQLGRHAVRATAAMSSSVLDHSGQGRPVDLSRFRASRRLLRDVRERRIYRISDLKKRASSHPPSCGSRTLPALRGDQLRRARSRQSDIEWVETRPRHRWSSSLKARSTRSSAFRPSRRSCAPARSVTSILNTTLDRPGPSISVA